MTNILVAYDISQEYDIFSELPDKNFFEGPELPLKDLTITYNLIK